MIFRYLTIGENFTIIFCVIGVWRSLVSRLVRVQEASGSNPDTPTKKGRLPFGSLPFLLQQREPEASWLPSPSGFRKAENEWGHTPQARLALLRVRIPILRPYRVFITDLSCGHSIFIIIATSLSQPRERLVLFGV